LLVKLKCNIDQIHGLNWVLVKKVKNFKIHYTIIHFYDKFVCYCKRNISTRGLSTCTAAKATQEVYPQKTWMKNRLIQHSKRLKDEKPFYTTFRAISWLIDTSGSERISQLCAPISFSYQAWTFLSLHLARLVKLSLHAPREQRKVQPRGNCKVVIIGNCWW
jgi:hypothetical protein